MPMTQKRHKERSRPTVFLLRSSLSLCLKSFPKSPLKMDMIIVRKKNNVDQAVKNFTPISSSSIKSATHQIDNNMIRISNSSINIEMNKNIIRKSNTSIKIKVNKNMIRISDSSINIETNKKMIRISDSSIKNVTNKKMIRISDSSIKIVNGSIGESILPPKSIAQSILPPKSIGHSKSISYRSSKK